MAVQAGGGAARRPGRQTTPPGGGTQPPRGSDAEQAAAFGGGYEDEPKTVEEAFDPGFFWQEAVVKRMQDEIKAIAKQYDMDLDFVLGWFGGQQLNLINYLQDQVIDLSQAPGSAFGVSPGFYTETPQGMAALFSHARNWLGGRFPALLDGLTGPGGGGRGRSGGGGSAGPTPDQIRAQFDLDQLTEAANTIWRGLILEDAPAARAMAKAYVETIVSNPEQKLDFEQFVLNQVRNTSRYQVIYRNKPESMSEQQFLAPIFQQVQQTLGPGYGSQVEDITINQARLAASPAATRERLMRERQVETSSPFLQNLGAKLGEVGQVLR